MIIKTSMFFSFDLVIIPTLLFPKLDEASKKKMRKNFNASSVKRKIKKGVCASYEKLS